MENQIDKLFRDKLEQHTVAPSAQAWEKLVTKTSKKNNPWLLSLRIAAAVAILAVVGWFSQDLINTHSVDVAETNPKLDNNNVINKVDSTIEVTTKDQVASARPDETVNAIQVEPKEKLVAAKQKTVKPAINDTANQPEEKNLVPDATPETSIASLEQEVNTSVVVEETPATPKPNKSVVIVYNLAPVQTTPETETVETAKVNRFKRVLEFAKDVKSGDATTYASVRNWKDNLLGSEEITKVEKHNNQ